MPKAPGMLEALRVRDFRLLWTGRFVSLLGSRLLTVAVPAHVLQITGSLMATGLTLAAEYLPVLLPGPLAGVLSDRWDRRRVMLTTDVVRTAAVATMLLADSPGTVWVIHAALAADAAPVGAGTVKPAPVS
ncbi:MFS transporter [Dactylosporangium sp. NPDC000521]|uniref:MFS transporter n=1 Tax=Dactylosporangium sp. NPDC000521 TaxID=3363975 RepID=UPI0036C6E28D